MAFRSLTEAIDTTTPTGRAMWQMVGILAELERSLIQERTKAGRSAAVARGVKMGRKPLLSPQQVAHARTLIEQGERHDTVAQSLNVSRRTLYRALGLPKIWDNPRWPWTDQSHRSRRLSGTKLKLGLGEDSDN